MKAVSLAFIIFAFAGTFFAQSSLSVKDETVTLFSGPDSGTYEIAILRKGDVVELIRSEYGSDWYYVSFKGARGWIHKSRLSEGNVEIGPVADRSAPAGKSERTVVDDHIDEVISRSPKSVRDRGLGELKDQRTLAYGDLDGDGDDDIVTGYVIGIGTEPRSSHIALFLNTDGAFRLLLDERLAAGTVARVIDVYGGRVFIEVSGQVDEFELVAGRLARAPKQDEPVEPEVEVPAVDAAEAAANAAAETANQAVEAGSQDDTPQPTDNQEAPPPPPPPPAPGELPTRISKGVINGSAIELPRPLFPEAARAVGASGTVNVAVVIDVYGGVISAAAVSGHPLLRSAAVDAARQARFRPTLLEGQPVEVSGVIVYNFGPPPGGDQE